jgi:RNA polymerase sigma-70 factor (ECF subfamily)|tara:strand:+ start:475 stop:1020 length:546 start_codon:yes stop_codon:yes gene_type:complete
MSDGELTLLQNVKNSDKAAFKQLFHQYYPTLFRFVVFRVHDKDLAEDIVQDTFLRVWNNRVTLDPKKSFFSYIAKISTNLCYDHFRYQEVRFRHKDTVPKPEQSHYDDPQKSQELNELQDEINRIVNEHLPEKCREIFILSRMEGLVNKDIAAILDLSKRTVENQLYRALKILKKHLQDYL